MAGQSFSRPPQGFKYLLRGLQLNRPLDLIPEPGYYPSLLNLRTYLDGSVSARPGINRINTTAVADLSIHSIRRMNNDLASASQAFTRYFGAGSSLYADNAAHNAFTAITGGFSGDPLSFVPFRPDQSAEPFTYVGDRTKMGKAKTGGTFRNMGTAAPTGPPTGPGTTMPSLNSFQFTTIDNGIGTAGSWVADGVAGPIWKVSSGTGPTDTFAGVVFDNGTTGWACFGITAPINGIFYQAGFQVTLSGATEVVIIDTVYKAVKNTTVASITYDAGTTGLCTIQPTAHKHKAWVNDTMIQIGAEYVRVLSVTFGDDNIPSIRCSTTSNHTAGEAITGVTSFRAFCVNNHTAGQTVTWASLSFSIGTSPAGELVANAPSSVGTGTRTITIDLGSVGGRPIQDDDYLNFIIYLDDQGAINGMASTISEVQIQLDCGDGTFLRDYFYVAIRPSDFAGTATGNTTALTAKQQSIRARALDETESPVDTTPAITRERLQRRIDKAVRNNNTKRVTRLQQRLADLPADGGGGGTGGGTGGGGGGGTGPGSGPGTSVPLPIGQATYAPVRVQIKDVTRFGTDFSKNWANISKIRVRALISNPNSTSVFGSSISFGSFWIGGAFGPDAGEAGVPYIYRYRYRASESGTKSFPSPATRSGVIARRQRVQLVAAASSDAQIDKIDWFRFGGTLLEWRYIGTGPNSTAQFNDDFPDDRITNNPLLDFNVQPFLTLGLPITGTCNVSGTAVTLTSGSVSTSMKPGTEVIINGVSATLYAPPRDSTHLDLVENIGALSAVSLFIPEPELMGQPLPIIWGPWGEGQTGTRLFAVGDPNNPGFLYWTNADDPDSVSETRGSLEITSPSEPLIAGCLFDGVPVVGSDRRWWRILPTGNIDSPFEAQELPVGQGIYARWGIAVGPAIYFIGKDGVYETTGGQAKSLTDDTLYSLFPHDGIAGSAVNSINPPDYTQPNFMQLEYGDGYLYFDYLDTSAAFRTMVYQIDATGQGNGWLLDAYTPGIRCHYWEEGKGIHAILCGGTDGRLYQYAAQFGDNNGTVNSAISCSIDSPALDMGDSRAKKTFGDYQVDADPQNVAITSQLVFDRGTSTSLTPAADSLTGTGRQRYTKDIAAGVGSLARTISLLLSWSSSSAAPKLYEFNPSFVNKGDDTIFRASDPTDLGYPGAKFVQALRIHCDTYNQPKSFAVQSDTGTNGAWVTQQTFTITHDGESIEAMSFDNAFITHMLRVISADTDPWRFDPTADIAFVFEPSPDLAMEWEGQETTFDGQGFLHLRDGYLAHISTADITLAITTDGVTNNYTITHGSGAYKKSYLPFLPLKAKAVKFKLISPIAFRLFIRDCEVKWKNWGEDGAYQVARPFGDMSRQIGATL